MPELVPARAPGAPQAAGAPGSAGVSQGHRGTRAIQRLVEYAPSTGGLALWMAHVDLPPPEAALPRARTWGRFAARRAPVATDGRALHYDASFEALTLPRQAGEVAHQVLHVALRHPQRFLELRARLGDVDQQLFNTCADAIVHSTLGHLGWLELPRDAVTLEKLLAAARLETAGVESALLEWDVERLYRAIDDRRDSDERRGSRDRPQRDGEGRGAREDGPRAASVRALGEDDAAADLIADEAAQGSPEDQEAATREWRERIVRAHAGDGEFSLLRALVADLPGSRTPWEQVLRTRLARGLSRKPALSWSRPARSWLANQGRAGAHGRLPWEPGHGGSRPAPRLALVVDVSGSIEGPLLERFARELEAILRRQEAALTLVIGDDQVRRVERIEPLRGTRRGFDLRGLEFHGGGGTDFTPLIEEADRHAPDIGVVLTDLEGPARLRPRWPVIWAVPPERAAAVPPFGRVLVLD